VTNNTKVVETALS